MIVVSIELQSAITGKIKTLGRMIIGNTGGTGKRGDYTVRVGNKKDVNDLAKVFNKPQREGTVKDYPRLSYNVWRLISRAILAAFPEERKGIKSEKRPV